MPTDATEMSLTIIRDESPTLWWLARELGLAFSVNGYPEGGYRVYFAGVDVRDGGMLGNADGTGKTLEAAMESLAELINKYRRLVIRADGGLPREVLVTGHVRAECW